MLLKATCIEHGYDELLSLDYKSNANCKTNCALRNKYVSQWESGKGQRDFSFIKKYFSQMSMAHV